MASRSRPFGAIVGLLALAWLFVPPPSSWTPRTPAPDVSGDATDDDDPDVPTLPPPPATPDDPPDDARLLVRVLSGSGAPVSGATVRIAGTGAYPPRAMRTNGSGLAAFSDLIDGRYVVRAVHHGTSSPTSAPLNLSSSPLEVTLTLATARAVRGRVVDDAGQPVGGAVVHIIERDASGLGGDTRTGPDGRFWARALPPDAASAYATADGYVASATEPLPSQDAELTLVVTRGAEVRGVVVDARDHPVAGARVELLRVGGGAALVEHRPGVGPLGVTDYVPPLPLAEGAAGPATSGSIASALSGDDGRFTLRSLPAGRISLRVTHPDHATALREAGAISAGQRRDGVEVRLLDGASLSGRVLDERGFPVAGVPLLLAVEREDGPRFAVSAEDGTYGFANARGVAELTARPRSGAAVRTRLELPDSGTLEQLVIIEAADGRLVGRVFAPNDDPIGGASVRVRSVDRRHPFEGETVSTADGTFELSGAPRGALAIRVESEGFASTRLRARADGPEIRVVLAPAGRVEAQVVDASGEPIAGAELRLEPDEGEARSARTDAEGRATFERIPLGPLTLSARASGHLAAETSAELLGSAYETPRLSIPAVVLSPASVVRGQVVDVVGEAAPGVRVELRGDGSTLSATTDAGGAFTLRDVPAGRFEAYAIAEETEHRATDPVVVEPPASVTGVHIALDSRATPVEDHAQPLQDGLPLTLLDQGGQVVADWVGPLLARQRVRPGDRITHIDGESVLIAAQGRAMLRGPVGSELTLTIISRGRERTLTLTRTRFRAPAE